MSANIRFQAICRLIPPSSGVDFSRLGLDLVLKASKSHCDVTLEYLKRGLDESLMETRRILVCDAIENFTLPI